MNTLQDVIIIGGGAAGFFTAINAAKANPKLSITILERGATVLNKVKVSGGGRCNVTHACFDPKELVSYYPRGGKELLGPFFTFSCADTFTWFEERGIALKTEEDGRVFPESNASQTIIDCFLSQAKQYGVNIKTSTSVKSFTKTDNTWQVETTSGIYITKALVVASGSNQKIWNEVQRLGHHIVKPVPSLFTFNVKDERIKDIPGVVVPKVSVAVLGTNLYSEGPLLLTHWGFSAPSILKLSAFGARILHDLQYSFSIKINFINQSTPQALANLKTIKSTQAKTDIAKSGQFSIPKRLWKKLVEASLIPEGKKWADATNDQLHNLAQQLTQAVFSVEGKSTFKEEFVTAGGVSLKEVNFKRFESKLHSNLFFAGEVLDVDAVTGGFNFQNAWTGGYIIAQELAS